MDTPKARRRYELHLFSGTHGWPLEYIVRLAPPDHCEAFLLVGCDDPWSRHLCFCCRDDCGCALIACAEALWREGAHPDSLVTMWFGEFPDSPPTPDRVQQTSIVAAVPQAYEAVCRKLAVPA